MNEMDTKTPTSSYHHQRAPRTPESYFNVPESIALLNIVKSERIQNAFQSNRKNHASVWEMVADILNRFSARKRTAKQCCNRYENLKKIYTQLKKNPERHVRRNWPYMILFKEIEEQRGECWGSNGKRLALINKNHTELSYYHRRRQAAELNILLNTSANKDMAQHALLQQLAAHSTDSSNSNNCKIERFLPNHFVETQLGENGPNENVLFDSTFKLQVAAAVAARNEHEIHMQNGGTANGLMDAVVAATAAVSAARLDINGNNGTNGNNNESMETIDCERTKNGESHPEYEKDCNGALNLQTNDNNISLKSEPMSEGEFNPDDIQLMQSNYNGSQNFYPHTMDTNILHPDVIVDTDNISDCSSIASIKSKRKSSSSTDGDSTNYELIEFLKRREKRDEELLKRMDAREERLVDLFERTVIALEALVKQKRTNTNDTILDNNNPTKETTDAKTTTKDN